MKTEKLSKISNKIANLKISKGTKLVSHKMVMVVTGETETSFTGYYEYKGTIVGQCSICKDMFFNPHYMNDIKIIN